MQVPNSVDSLGIYPFRSDKLRSIDLGSGLKKLSILNIDSPDIDVLICRAVVPPTVIEFPQLGSNLLGVLPDEMYGHTVLFVPEASIEAYKDAEHWCRFLNIKSIEKDLAGIDSAIVDDPTVKVIGNEIIVEGYNGNITVLNLAGRTVYNGPATTVAVAESGVYIVRVAGKTYKLMVN